MVTQPEPLLDVGELAAYLRLLDDSGNPDRQAIYWARYKGKCPPAIRVAGKLRWRRSTVDAWLASQTEPAASSR